MVLEKCKTYFLQKSFLQEISQNSHENTSARGSF